MIQIPLAGFYSIDQACAALSNSTTEVYPENLLRLVANGTLNVYCEIFEYLQDYSEDEAISSLDFSFGKKHFGSFELPENWLNVIIDSYHQWRISPQFSNMSEHFDCIHWFPTTINLHQSRSTITFDTKKFNYLQFPSSREFYFNGDELNQLFGIPSSQPKQSRESNLDLPSSQYVSALRILASLKAGSIPEKSISISYLSKLLKDDHINEFKNTVSRDEQCWTNHLIKYHRNGVKRISREFKNNLCFLAVSIGGEFPSSKTGTHMPDFKWVSKLIKRLPTEDQAKLLEGEWLEILKL